MANPIRVLILEDRQADAELMVAELRRADFELTWQLVGTEADFAANLDPRPDVILADYNLPGWDGLKALDLLTERGFDIPVVMVTGSLGDEMAAECIKRGAADFLLKDRLTRLGPAVSQALEQTQLRRETREANAALRASEERYRTVVDNVNDAIVVNVGELRAFVNRAYLDLIGLEDDAEVIGSRIDKFIVPEDREGVTQRSLARQRGEGIEAVYEYRIRRPDGEIRTVQASAVATTFDGEPATLAILRDVTAFKQAEDDIRARSEELQALFNVASILSSPGTLSEQVTGVLEQVMTLSEASSAHLRVPEESARGLRLIASIGLGVEERAQGVVRAFGETRSGEVFERGEPVIANDYGAARRTGPRETDDVSRGSSAQSAIWLPVKSGGRTVGVISVSSLEPDHFTPQRIQMLTAIGGGIGTFVENANLGEAERLHVAELEATVDQLRTAQQQLIQSEKLAAVGTLISGVAHEINNPLGNILGRVQLLQRAAAGDESKRDLQTVRDECERAIRIVRNLLSFTREHMPETTLVSLNDVIDQVLELRAYELKVSNIELRKDFQADLPEISGDPHQLQQVFLNLVINAEQAMTAAYGRGVLSITAQQVGEAIHVVVADDGPGIPDGLLSQIFDPFFTTKEVGKGTGLGLSVCYGIVKEHGGEMRVESEEGKGTTFTVELPLPPQG